MTQPSFFAELKRRNIYRAAAIYAASAWLLMQVAGQVLPTFHGPEWVLRWIMIAAAIGFPFWIAFAWFYEITPEGIKRESEIEPHESITAHTGKRMDRWIIAILAVAVVLLLTDRFLLRHEPAADVASGSTATAIPEIEADPSIAVLPLVNMSDDKANEFFSDGISEELLNLLAKVPKLRVIARTSSFSFKGKDVSIPEIARELRVASVLEGSVRKSAEKVRITVQLIRAKDGSHLWSETYDRTIDDIFKVQDEIAAVVVQQLQIKLLGAAPTVKPVDPRVYSLVLQAQALLDRQDAAARTQAIEAYKKALAIAPGEARPWAGLSRAYLNQVIFGERAATEGAPAIKEAANKALAIEPDNVLALASLGRVAAEIDFDMPEAARYYQRALRIEPGSLTIANAAGLLLANVGRLDEGLALLEYRVTHDPASPTAYNNLGGVQYVARHWDAAIDSLRTAIRLSPAFPSAHYQVGTILLQGKHDASGALSECEAEQHDASRSTCMALALHALGRASEADTALDAMIARHGKEQPTNVASVYAYRGRADTAFEWLERAAASNDSQLSVVLTDPLFDSLHDDPRWLPFLRKIGYAPGQLAKIEFKVTLPQ